MSENTINKLSDEQLSHVNGGEDVEIVFGTKDLSSGNTQNIQSYTEPESQMTIVPFVENTNQTIQEYQDPSGNNFYREGGTCADDIPVVPYRYKKPGN